MVTFNQARSNRRAFNLGLMPCLFVLSIGVLHQAFSQETSSDNHTDASSVWASLGIGTSYFGPTFRTALSYSIGNNVFTVRYLKGDELRFSVEGQYDQPALGFKELGILYGRISRKQFLLVGLSIGMGYVNGTDRGRQIEYGKYEPINISAFSFLLEATVLVDITNFLGIGGSVFGSLNSQKTYLGGTLNVYVGKL